jgi:hypothetical protein
MHVFLTPQTVAGKMGLVTNPIRELARLRGTKHSGTTLGQKVTVPRPSFDVEARVSLPAGPAVSVDRHVGLVDAARGIETTDDNNNTTTTTTNNNDNNGTTGEASPPQTTISVAITLAGGVSWQVDIAVAAGVGGTVAVADGGAIAKLVLAPDESEIDVRVVSDRSIIEVFVQGGRIAHTSRVYTTKLGPATVVVTSASPSSASSPTSASSASSPTSSSASSPSSPPSSPSPTDGLGAAVLKELTVYELNAPSPDPELERLAALLR